MNNKLYPLLFQPLYKKVAWGGSAMSSVLARSIPDDWKPCGEAWEICDRCDAQSVVENGSLKGQTIRSLREEFGTALISDSFQGGRFPLLVKLIDAGTHLSVQVHPDEDACAQIGGTADPKTEMWYLLHTEQDAKIFAGLSDGVTPESFARLAKTPQIADCLVTYPARPGDAFFIRSGTVHAIGGGNLLLEIQQNSDTTYRASDWNRLGIDGKPRELHLEKALQCIDFKNHPQVYVKGSALPGSRPVVSDCPFFRCTALNLKNAFRDSTTRTHGFHLISAVRGMADVMANGITTSLPFGRTCLIPACLGDYMVKPSGEASILQTTL